jgi:hypothetical protein
MLIRYAEDKVEEYDFFEKYLIRGHPGALYSKARNGRKISDSSDALTERCHAKHINSYAGTKISLIGLYESEIL